MPSSRLYGTRMVTLMSHRTVTKCVVTSCCEGSNAVITVHGDWGDWGGLCDGSDDFDDQCRYNKNRS